MDASSPTHPLQADKPKVIVLGDGIIDWHIYDNQMDEPGQSLGFASPLSRDDWHYAPGFRARQCLAGANMLHVMLRENGIATASNVFPVSKAFLNPRMTGSVFVLRQRANPGKTEEERTRAYLTKFESRTWRDIIASSPKDALKRASTDRSKTWRTAINLLNKNDLEYVHEFDSAKCEYDRDSVQAICFFDAGRGFFRRRAPDKIELWSKQQDSLFAWYSKLCDGNRKPAILIRTSDPSQFERFLDKLAKQAHERPIVVIMCALAQLDEGDLESSGTWSEVWAQTYDYLNQERNRFLLNSARDDWNFHHVVPVYEDGVIWIGPDCWPIKKSDRTEEFLRRDTRPIGKLIMVPGTQPGLSEYEEHSRIVGVYALLTYSVLEHLAEAPSDADLAPAIKKGLMRSRRLRSHGYCTEDETFAIEDEGQKFWINYPCEIWKKGLREATDLLLKIRDEKTGQYVGPYEAQCRVKFPHETDRPRRSPASLRIFHTIEKIISDEYVASPQNCIRVVGDVGQEKDTFKHLNLAIDRNDHWIDIERELCPLDSFAKAEVQAFRLRQRISMQFGNFAMADPREAAPMLDLAQRLRQHVFSNRYNSPDDGKVFNFALFGSPGSGKSFLAREIARLIDSHGAIFNVEEFNLSQFTETAQLTRALEQIASKSVGGKVPLVLWDEFDSVIDAHRGGWLARFLMPMQDAHFFDGQQRRPIGTAVFAFIGGTFPAAEEFRAWACTTGTPTQDPSEAVLLKARDFHSRLYTALDMPSIIEREDHTASPSGPRCQIFRTTWDNSYAKLARAVLLREFFRKKSRAGKTPFLKSVEDDLCKFLLAIPLRHGARSMERIVEACLVSNPSRVSMIHLPPSHFLAEHIETENVQRDDGTTSKITIDQMIEACRR
jgi:hypothetical protein